MHSADHMFCTFFQGECCHQKYLISQIGFDKHGIQTHHLTDNEDTKDFLDYAIKNLDNENWVPSTEVLKDLHSEFA